MLNMLFVFQGDGDSEIALVVEDDDMVDSYMNHKPYQVSRFATSLRRKLFRGGFVGLRALILDSSDHCT